MCVGLGGGGLGDFCIFYGGWGRGAGGGERGNGGKRGKAIFISCSEFEFGLGCWVVGLLGFTAKRYIYILVDGNGFFK